MNGEPMKRNDELTMKDTLREEYDLESLKVRRLGSERKHFAGVTVQLEPDVAEVFPNTDAVNEALRVLIRIMRDNRKLFPGGQSSTSDVEDTLQS